MNAGIKAGEAFRRKMETDPETRAGWERARVRLKNFASAIQLVTESPEFKAAQEAERRALQVFADAIRDNLQWTGDVITDAPFDGPKSIDDWLHLARIVEIPFETIRAGNLTAGEIFEFAMAWADRQKIQAKLAAEANMAVGQGEPAETARDSSSTPKKSKPTKAKRSTERGEGRVKLIAALTKHHEYSQDRCQIFEPIRNNELARLACVSYSTASAFFNWAFNRGKSGGHAKYRAKCRDAGSLVDYLKALRGEFTPAEISEMNLEAFEAGKRFSDDE